MKTPLGIAAMTLGILSLVLVCCCTNFSVTCSIGAIVLGVLSLKREAEKKGFAITGIVTGIVGIVLFVVIISATVYMKKTGLYQEIEQRIYEQFGIEQENAGSYGDPYGESYGESYGDSYGESYGDSDDIFYDFD